MIASDAPCWLDTAIVPPPWDRTYAAACVSPVELPPNGPPPPPKPVVAGPPARNVALVAWPSVCAAQVAGASRRTPVAAATTTARQRLSSPLAYAPAVSAAAITSNGITQFRL